MPVLLYQENVRASPNLMELWNLEEKNILWSSEEKNILWNSEEKNILWNSEDKNILWNSEDKNILWNVEENNTSAKQIHRNRVCVKILPYRMDVLGHTRFRRDAV